MHFFGLKNDSYNLKKLLVFAAEVQKVLSHPVIGHLIFFHHESGVCPLHLCRLQVLQKEQEKMEIPKILDQLLDREPKDQLVSIKH